MTGAEIELLREIGKLPPVETKTFVITAADDWPMFLTMIKFAGGIFVGAWGTIIGLLIHGFKGVKTRIGSQRAEDAKRCESCKGAIWDHIGGPVWEAIESCSPEMNNNEKLRLRDEIRRHAEGIDLAK